MGPASNNETDDPLAKFGALNVPGSAGEDVNVAVLGKCLSLLTMLIPASVFDCAIASGMLGGSWTTLTASSGASGASDG